MDAVHETKSAPQKLILIKEFHPSLVLTYLRYRTFINLRGSPHFMIDALKGLAPFTLYTKSEPPSLLILFRRGHPFTLSIKMLAKEFSTTLHYYGGPSSRDDFFEIPEI